MAFNCFAALIFLIIAANSDANSGCCPNKGGYCGFDLKRCKRTDYGDCSDVIDNALYKCQHERSRPDLVRECQTFGACFNNDTHVFCKETCCTGIGLFCGHQLKKCKNVNEHAIYDCQPNGTLVLVENCQKPGVCFNDLNNGTSCTTNCCAEKGNELCGSRFNRCGNNMNRNAIYRCLSIGDDPVLVETCSKKMICRSHAHGDFCPNYCCPYPGTYCASELSTRCREINSKPINGRNLYRCDNNDNATLLQTCSHMCIPRWSNSSCSEEIADNCGHGMYKEHSTCIACSIGHKCDGYKSTPCEPGTYQSLPQKNHCHVCTPGYYQPASGLHFCMPCPRGHFCNDPTMASLCPVGRFQNGTGKTVCLPCPKDTYAFENGSKVCEPCPAGHFCIDVGTVNPKPCMNGTYAAEGQGLCKSCLPGYYTENSMSDSCLPCPLGHYCDASAPLRCLPGTFADETGLAVCKSCPIGHTAPVSGSQDCEACPVGHYCPLKHEVPISCPASTYSDRLEQTICKSCEPGFFAAMAGSDRCIKCKVDHMCFNGTIIPCSPGKYQPNLGQMNCIECKGEQEALRNPACQRCVGSGNCDKKTKENEKCSDGYYRSYTTRLCMTCPEGYFCKNEETFPCNRGFHQPHKGQTSCIPCKKGMYSSQKGAISCELCRIGHKCTDGAHEPEICMPGSHQPREGESICLLCSEGYYQPKEGQSNCLPCPKGHFCQINVGKLGNYAAFPIPCTKGMFQNKEGQTNCSFCNEGFYTSSEASTKCLTCSDHTYCPGRGTSQPFLCPAGSTAPGLAHTTCNDCGVQSSCLIPGSGICGQCSSMGTYIKHITNIRQNLTLIEKCLMKQKKCFMDAALNSFFGEICGILDTDIENVQSSEDTQEFITEEIKVAINSSLIKAQLQFDTRKAGKPQALKTTSHAISYAEIMIDMRSQIIQPILSMAKGKETGTWQDLAANVIKMLDANIELISINTSKPSSNWRQKLLSRWERVKTLGHQISKSIPFKCNIYEAITDDCHHFLTEKIANPTSQLTVVNMNNNLTVDYFARMWISTLQPFTSIIDRFPTILFFLSLSTNQCRREVISSFEKLSDQSHFLSEFELSSINNACIAAEEIFIAKEFALLINRTFARLNDKVLDDTILYPAIMAVTKTSGFLKHFEDGFAQNTFHFKNKSISNLQVNKILNDWSDSVFNATTITDGIVFPLEQQIHNRNVFLLSAADNLKFEAIYIAFFDDKLHNCSEILQVFKISADYTILYSVNLYRVKKIESDMLSVVYIIRDIKENILQVENPNPTEGKFSNYVMLC